MGKVTDASAIQFRMLNRTKGPAMHSPRAQADKKLYQFTMKHRVEAQENLTLRQEIVEGLLVEPMKNEERTTENEPILNSRLFVHSSFRICGVLARGDTLYRAP